MQGNLNVGRIWGIPIQLHVSWFLIFGLVIWSLASGYFPQEYPELGGVAYWLLGALTSVLFFGSVLLHELGHSWVALRNRIGVRNITLFIFGGVAQIEREARRPGEEFRIAIAGPIVSGLLAVLFGLLWVVDHGIPLLAAPSIWLMRINLGLALFNMIPGFPLDGGRVLRALVWRWTGNYRRATQIASFTGQAVAFAFIGFGVWTVLNGNLFNGLWLAFIGWFLQNAAAASYAQVTLQEQLRGVKVGQVMAEECTNVSGQVSVRQLVEESVLGRGQRCFFVADNGQIDGILSLRDVTAVPRASWDRVKIAEVMVPWEQMTTVDPQMELWDALRLLDDKGLAQVPVVQGRHMVGTLSREQVLHYIRTRATLGM